MSDFFSDDESDDSDEEYEGAILKMYFLGSIFENVFLKRAILKMYFLTEQFLKIFSC